MNFEDIESEQIKYLVKYFYVHQSALITTPLGTTGVNNKPKYPTYFNKYHAELDRLAKELLRFEIKVTEARLPERSNSLSATSFLDDFERQQALKFVLTKDGEVLQPPVELCTMVKCFIEKLKTPWH
ncbi:hypothetical protein [Uliginosibacterium aquaticum]|uniref:Uncharacterized protein n=1 Tax=Uliginosibacterium aquaticum TaxID=2731212 RepID=A0ABX2IQS7_9RHOO|nr:hypothetical protein [Uliginosibacterium aquaticum]NSL56350.1 hypothetical protein [Uliginosibacterium aquaticum]